MMENKNEEIETDYARTEEELLVLFATAKKPISIQIWEESIDVFLCTQWYYYGFNF